MYFEGSYKEGKENGLFKLFYKNGGLMSKGHFKNGNQDGLWEYFNEDGSIQKIETYWWIKKKYLARKNISN